jgi:hypothetical protein
MVARPQSEDAANADPAVGISGNDVAGLPCDAYLHGEAHSSH